MYQWAFPPSWRNWGFDGWELRVPSRLIFYLETPKMSGNRRVQGRAEVLGMPEVEPTADGAS